MDYPVCANVRHAGFATYNRAREQGGQPSPRFSVVFLPLASNDGFRIH